ncbi:ribbon-helix-helix domain-containing protein [Bacillus sp. FSL K6-6540]|uniref:ribbon-helix-helix domain-containing protein n=1 Tax=Bacillus sp. FSL K6-6540 TaxID=2921512 RepID=UPI0030FB241B
MGQLRKIQLYIDEDLLKKLDAEASVLNMNRSEFIRDAIELKLSNGAAVEGIETTMRLLRRVIEDSINPQFNRMAKMIAKDTKASATSMYLNVLHLAEIGRDSVNLYKQAESKAAAYLTSKE